MANDLWQEHGAGIHRKDQKNSTEILHFQCILSTVSTQFQVHIITSYQNYISQNLIAG